ncbi:hypothetical protein SAMN05660860_01886 [Geoalkalibacter ferrihydriticus]|uniref:Uncharacterized protein n=2 Tax=Geoalkalibacter ferrihydriticus TaxID=392333 RepID=A0A0C2HTQ9_9BACT|nr:hypothetical protein [Geoalkalibacter ferrihydriticus]KIH78185.1 hypothetical protein GFER_01705 [Geoalkalibacter ferrihydriticus DSM 17813]SDM13811.1 hypothetical protein SAMN05660860_01886 [Geoalkalibacter ferrihydriticus]
MPLFARNLIETPVDLPRRELLTMMRLARDLFHLSRLAGYRALIAPQIPAIAAFDPGHDAVMMGYDFHLGPNGPRLIEVNTNAGGGLLAYLAHRPKDRNSVTGIPLRLQSKLLQSFAQEMQRHSGGGRLRPQRIAIVDENPATQFLYPEMQAFQRLFQDWGVPAVIADPTELEEREGALFHQGQALSLIYNRHCDFYLESPAMAAIARAYAEGNICLTPNPFSYALLGDKRRMVLWSDAEALREFGLHEKMSQRILSGVPYSRLLVDLGAEAAWQQRKNLVFKPVTRFGSRGVYMGASISRTRFNSLPLEHTLAQTLVPPSLTPSQNHPLKTDFRLFAYRDHILGIAARLYQGQVTNMQSEGSGFAPVRIIP